MIKKGIATVAQQHYAGYASEFWQKEKSGENSLPTPSPQGEHKDHCAKLDWWVDAVAVAEMKNEIIKMQKDADKKILSALNAMKWIRGISNIYSYYLARLV